jgi:hypothetical protein
MIKKILFGVLWFIVFYFFACFVTGAIAGAKDPQHAAEAGSLAGARTVAAIRIYLALGSLAFASIGSWKGFLPGTRRKSPPPLPPESI